MDDKMKGVWIDADIWLSDLKLIEKHLAQKIKDLDNEKGCYATNSFFSSFLGVSKSRCTQIIKSLEDKGVIKVSLFKKGKQITGRVLNFLSTPIEKTKEGIEKTKLPIEFSKHPYLENYAQSNIDLSNTFSNLEEIIKEKEKKEKKLLQRIEKLKAENIALKAKLQKEKKVAPKKDFAPDIPLMPGFTPKHENQANAPSKKYQQELQGFQFPAHWSQELIDAFMDYCDSMDFKKAGKWGTMRQLQSEINQIESNLVKHEMKLVAGAIKFAADKGNTTYNIEWHKNRMKNEKPTNRKEASTNSASSTNGNIFDAFEKGFSSGGDSFGQSETDFEIPIQEY
jgi:DNA-binding Lrp family transcriptional regulator